MQISDPKLSDLHTQLRDIRRVELKESSTSGAVRGCDNYKRARLDALDRVLFDRIKVGPVCKQSYSVSTKRDRQSSRCRHENRIISSFISFIMPSMLWLSRVRFRRPCMNSSSGLRLNRKKRTLWLSLASDTEAHAGHLGRARELTKRSIDSALRVDSNEAGDVAGNCRKAGAAVGNTPDVKQEATRGLNSIRGCLRIR